MYHIKSWFFSLAYFITFVFTSLLISQNIITIKGNVIDAQTLKRLPDANILIEELGLGTTSDKEGNFIITNVPAGEYIISASFIGYRVSKQHIDIRNQNEIFVSMVLLPIILEGQSIEITATRAAQGESPVSFSNIPRDELEYKYTASDIPMMLDELPSVYSYSLTGDNLGYSFLKIRGFDQTRVGVMINDIPLNDPEDQQVYWVDHPDLVESIEDIQIQRGVGSSIYGTSTFGGSVNIKTKNYSSERLIKVILGSGSFNTRKMSAEYRSGLIMNSYGFYGRFSRINSDGYRKYSSSDLLSYFLGFERYDRNMVTRINIFDGHERTHPDWDGVPQDILKTNRRYKRETYENAVDDFRQPQIHLINDWQINSKLNLTNTLYFVHGEGYYENYKDMAKLMDFGMNNFETMDPNLFGADSLLYYQTNGEAALFKTDEGMYVLKSTDLTRRKWINKNQYGWIGKLAIAMPDGILTLGTSLYNFKSNHHGRVLWAKYLPSIYGPERNYYQYDGEKNSVSLYANYIYDIFPSTKLLANIFYEYKSYYFKQKPTALFSGDMLNQYDVIYNFVSPRMGINHKLTDNFSFYGNMSYAQREPADNELFDTWTGPDDLGANPLFAKNDTIRSGGKIDYIKWHDPYVKPESVLDYEVGISYDIEQLSLKANFYYMDFSNEIVPLGGTDKDGFPIKGNADMTVHRGLEFSASYLWSRYIKIEGNMAWSRNYYKKFLQQDYNGVIENLSGNSIAGFPDIISNFRITTFFNNISASLLVKHVGKQYLDNTQSSNHIINPFTRIDLMFDYRLNKLYYFPEVRFILKVNNVLNEEYETSGYYDSWSDTAYFYPAAIRNYYFAIIFNL